MYQSNDTGQHYISIQTTEFVYEDDEKYGYILNCDIAKSRAVGGIEHVPNTYSPISNKKFRLPSF